MTDYARRSISLFVLNYHSHDDQFFLGGREIVWLSDGVVEGCGGYEGWILVTTSCTTQNPIRDTSVLPVLSPSSGKNLSIACYNGQLTWWTWHTLAAWSTGDIPRIARTRDHRGSRPGPSLDTSAQHEQVAVVKLNNAGQNVSCFGKLQQIVKLYKKDPNSKHRGAARQQELERTVAYVFLRNVGRVTWTDRQLTYNTYRISLRQHVVHCRCGTTGTTNRKGWWCHTLGMNRSIMISASRTQTAKYKEGCKWKPFSKERKYANSMGLDRAICSARRLAHSEGTPD